MNIKEYQEKFNELFKQLQEEHGKPSKVVITSSDICGYMGETIESVPNCSILFE